MAAVRQPRAGRGALVGGLVLGAAVLAVLHAWRGDAYWNYSEGVYALTSRLLLRGHDVYGHVVAAQPPWQFGFGAAALWIHDSLGFLRLAVGAALLAAGGLSAVTVWRLTGNRWAAALAPALTLLTPWALHEHGALTPELLAPAPLMGAALLASRERTAAAAGALAATAPFLKWPFGLALVAIVALSASPRRAAVGAAVALAVQALAFTAIFGGGLWTDSLLAQLHSGHRGLGYLKGVFGQAAWSLAGLVVLAAFALRGETRDPPLRRVLAGLAVAQLATLVTMTKNGTGLNILVPIEAALVPLALAGAVRAPRPLVAVLAAFTLAQSVSLVASPRTATPFIFPTSERGAWGIVQTRDQIRADVAAARACPPGVAYNGPPFVAFLAHRPMADDQPDQFLPFHSSTLAATAARMAAVRRLCP
jgi:hypothetical protein